MKSTCPRFRVGGGAAGLPALHHLAAGVVDEIDRARPAVGDGHLGHPAVGVAGERRGPQHRAALVGVTVVDDIALLGPRPLGVAGGDRGVGVVVVPAARAVVIVVGQAVGRRPAEEGADKGRGIVAPVPLFLILALVLPSPNRVLRTK